MSIAYWLTCQPTIEQPLSVDISTNIYRSTIRPSVDWYVGRYIDRHILVDRHLTDMSTNILVDTWPIRRLIHRLRVGWYDDQHIGWGVHIKYTWSPSSGLVLSSGPSQDPKMKPKLTLEWYQSSQMIHWIISSSICKLDQINSMCEITHQIVVSN